MSAGLSIVATLGLNRGQFRTEAERTRGDLETISAKVREAAGAVAYLERQLSSGAGTTAQRQQLSALKMEHRELAREMKLLEAQSRSLNAVLGEGSSGGGHGGHGGGGGGGNKGQLAHSGRATLEMIMAGQSPLQAAQVEAPRVVQAFGGGLGTMLGVGAGFAVLNTVRENISETIAKAKELKSALMEALRPGPSQGEKDGTGLRAQLKELDTVIEEAAPKLGKLERMWQGLGNRFNASGVAISKLFQGKFGESFKDSFATGQLDEDKTLSGQNAKLREEAEHRREDTLRKIVGLETDANTLKEKAFAHGEESIKQAQLELEKKQKLAQIEEELGIAHAKSEIAKIEADPTKSDDLKRKQIEHLRHELEIKQKTAAELQSQEQRGFDLRQKEAQRSEYAAQKMVEMEERILAIKKEGVNVDVRSAKARLEVAVALLNSGPKEGIQHDKNQAALDAAKLGVEDAERGVARNKVQRQIDEDLAKNDAPEPVQKRNRLNREIGALSDRNREGSDTYERDEEKRKDIQRDIAQKQSELRALDRDEQGRAFRRRDAEIEANQRPGVQGQIEAIDQKLQNRRNEAAANQKGNNDPEIASRVNKEAAEFNRQRAELVRKEEAAVRAAKEHTREMDLHQRGLDHIARVESIRFRYQEQINQALRDGNKELAGQLSKQSLLEQKEERRKAYLSTPQDRLKEQQEAAQKARDDARFERDDGLLNISRGMDGKPIEGYDPIKKTRRKFGDHSLYEAGVPGNEVDGGKSPVPGTGEPDRRGQAMADPQAMPNGGKGGNGDVVSAIKEQTTAIVGAVSFKNQE